MRSRCDWAGILLLVHSDLEDRLRRIGGVGHRADLLAAGSSVNDLRAARRSGALLAVRRSWYAVPDASDLLVEAVRIGGALTAVSAAALRGWWVLDDGRLHVAVPRNASRLRRSTGDGITPALCLHWTREATEVRGACDRPADILRRLAECQPVENVVATIDSALQLRAVHRGELERASACAGAGFRRAVALSDGASQSGTETLVRVRLRSLRIMVATQVFISGLGRVDLLVGDCLIVECDSRTHHLAPAAYENDRRRDLAAHRLGYVVIRLSYHQVVHDWPMVEQVILDMVRRRAHRATAVRTR